MQILNSQARRLPMFTLSWEVDAPSGSGQTFVRATSIPHARALFAHYFPSTYRLVGVSR